MESTNTEQSLKPVFNLLRITFVIVPIVAGLDKFTNLLTSWEHYINPSIATMLPFPAPTFMKIVGVIEIVAGFIVLRKAAPGGYIVAAWLTLIAVTLLVGFHYPDVAVRDLVMAIGAFSMAKMAGVFSSGKQ
ncbi:hypothetical protein LL912_11705 [Niabella sp. CC-SYL272]|uniref:hypothetical protein n=1 Tax=Niabella agricola TaxID=2891571 RepID=UPI001F3FF5B3|nr:hypothetical protein [Niabella agricola]MCF3109441.1 hypothetical protein [Niabella agricola]